MSAAKRLPPNSSIGQYGKKLNDLNKALIKCCYVFNQKSERFLKSF
jgi:hypothetical protein